MASTFEETNTGKERTCREHLHSPRIQSVRAQHALVAQASKDQLDDLPAAASLPSLALGLEFEREHNQDPAQTKNANGKWMGLRDLAPDDPPDLPAAAATGFCSVEGQD